MEKNEMRWFTPLALTSLALALNACTPAKTASIASDDPYIGTGYVSDTAENLYGAKEINFINVDGWAIAGGDIILEPTVSAESSSTTLPMVVGNRDRLWPDGYIPYEIHAGFTEEQKKPIIQAIANWNTFKYKGKQLIKLFDIHDASDPNRLNDPSVPNSGDKVLNHKSFITIKPWPLRDNTDLGAVLDIGVTLNTSSSELTKSVCFSRVGRYGDSQKLYLDPWIDAKNPGCEIPDIMHAIGHTVGLFHPHNRNSRDEDVNILWGNIGWSAPLSVTVDSTNQYYVGTHPVDLPTYHIFFLKAGALGIDFGDYDFASIMHFPVWKYGEVVNPPDSGVPYDPALHPYRWEETVETTSGATATVWKYADRKQTLVPIPEKLSAFGIAEEKIGTATSLSAGDLQRVHFLYANHWVNDAKSATYKLPVGLTTESMPDAGRRFIDVNSDGHLDLLYNRARADLSLEKGAYFNPGTSGGPWVKALSRYEPPHPIVRGPTGTDGGARFVDVDNDGDLDFLYHFVDLFGISHRAAFLNDDANGDGINDGWTNAPQYSPPPLARGGVGSMGMEFVDLNGDNLLDMMYNRRGLAGNHVAGAWLNTGAGWKQVGAEFEPPRETSNDGTGYTGFKLVDVDHDGLKDFLFHRVYLDGTRIKVAYLNSGAGWTCDAPTGPEDESVWDPNCSSAFFEKFGPPRELAAIGLGVEDRGSRFVDLNGDKKLDFISHLLGVPPVAYVSAVSSKGEALGWVPADRSFVPPIAIAADGVGDYGRRFVDINNDGRVDLLFNRQALVPMNHEVGAYLNKPTGWEFSGNDAISVPFAVVGIGDVGKKFVDVNGDKFVDIVYKHTDVLGRETNEVYLNGNTPL